jgi:hypothetical protein
MKPITFSVCFLGIHSRAKEWVFVGEGKCDQEFRCSRCGHGLGQSRASHDFANWQYVGANECTQVRTCRRCGCEQTRLYMIASIRGRWQQAHLTYGKSSHRVLGSQVPINRSR